MTYWRILAVTLALLGLALASEKAVQIIRPPAFVPSSSTVRYQIRIPRHPDNRLLVFSAIEDGTEVRRTETDLDGDQAAITHWIAWRLNTGAMTLVAQLYGVNGRQARDTAAVCVYSSLRPCGGEPEP